MWERLVTGPVGVGKSSVLHEEEIARCWPEAIGDARTAFAFQNLASLWSNFVAVGASRLLLSGLVEQRSDLRLISEAVPDAALTVVRLPAPLSVLERRVRLREPASPEGELDGGRVGGRNIWMSCGSRITWSRPRTDR